MNDDLLKYNPERDIDMDKEIKKTSSPPSGGSKLSTIFLIVLGVHVIVIIGVSAFHLLRGNKDNAQTQDVAAVQEQAVSSEGQPLAATTSEQPTLETSAALAQQAATDAAAANTKMSTPSMSDPVWNMQQPVSTPALDQAEKVETTPVAQLTEEPVKPAKQAITGSYTVVAGDNLSKIARKTGVSISDIRKANKLKKDIIKIGQKLTLPAKGVAKTKEKVAAKTVAKSSVKKQLTLPLVTPILPATPVASTEGYRVYRVEKGDTLSKIARLFHTTPAKLTQINGLTDPHKLKVGMSIKVPGEQVATQQAAPATSETQDSKPFRAPVSNTDLAMLRGEESM